PAEEAHRAPADPAPGSRGTTIPRTGASAAADDPAKDPDAGGSRAARPNRARLSGAEGEHREPAHPARPARPRAASDRRPHLAANPGARDAAPAGHQER